MTLNRVTSEIGPLAALHPAVSGWFSEAFEAPTPAQTRGWPAIQAGGSTLIAAPTGSGKTLAAFLVAIDDLMRQGLEGSLEDGVQVVYVSPLKALAADIACNLDRPLQGIAARLRAAGLEPPDIRAMVRTGDTPARDRAALAKRPPHILVTTPESLYLLLTSASGQRALGTARLVIVDEIHALLRRGDKRGAHLALSMARLDALVGRPLPRVGLSATVRPLAEVARFLVGTDGAPAVIVDETRARPLDLAVEMPRSPLDSVMSNEAWDEVYDRLAQLIEAHKTTLVFTNTRRQSERLAKHLGDRLGSEDVAAHHGSLARERRARTEARFRAGELRAIVATASLELGIDVGSVELVCQIGSPGSISSALQRIGRARHQVGGVPAGRLFPLSLDDLAEQAALLRAIRGGDLEPVCVPDAPLDVLAQQIVATAADADLALDDLYALVRRAWPYRDLTRDAFDQTVQMLADGFSTRRGRRGALLHKDAVHGRVRGRRGARITALTSGGAIPDNADYDVIIDATNQRVGSVHEDFAIESLPGDVFALGNASWQISRVERGRVRVNDAAGKPPTIPFWVGEAPGRSGALSGAVASLRAEVAARLELGGLDAAVTWLRDDVGLDPVAAGVLAAWLADIRTALGALPTQDTLVVERFFDQVGDQHLVLHAPFGARLNRAWGLALRKRFCQSFNFELQAAATDDAVLLSLGPTHSFPLDDVFRFLHPATVRDALTQALLDAPIFGVRWRHVATRSLAVPRFRGGKRVPLPIARMEAEDLVAVVFPDQLACLENVVGKREIPDHPLVTEALRDCLEEAMDLPGLEAVLTRLVRGELTLVARDVREPSPLAAGILVARPWAFLDDAPLEERRVQAVYARRWGDQRGADDLGALDPAAIDAVRAEVWPTVRDPDELHDALCWLGFVTAEEGEAGGWLPWMRALVTDGRATVVDGARWVAAERLGEHRAASPGLVARPLITPPPGSPAPDDPDEALAELLRARLDGLGPITVATLCADFSVEPLALGPALAALEVEGFAMQGRFSPGPGPVEWCARRVLARVHRATVGRLRKAVAPVAPADFGRFLLRWQRALPDVRAEGPEGLFAVLEQLEGFAAPAAAWEDELLPLRVRGYDPAWLDLLCLSGRVTWWRADPTGASTTVRATPIAFARRERAELWQSGISGPELTPDPTLQCSPEESAVLALLQRSGARFFDELARDAGLSRRDTAEALDGLVARGLIASDGFGGLRALLAPGGLAGRRTLTSPPGRWSEVRPGAADPDDALAARAAALLRRYGVVFRAVLARERGAPPWRDLVRFYRRMEDRGELRGGRFVEGFSGEQYALPEAVGLLRDARGAEAADLVVSGADPLNLTGALGGGERVPSTTAGAVTWRDGVPAAAEDQAAAG